MIIEGGFPGHAIIVMDMVINKQTGEQQILLAQSFMPAQDIHIIKNLDDKSTSPWYTVKKSGELETAEWGFDWDDVREFE